MWDKISSETRYVVDKVHPTIFSDVFDSEDKCLHTYIYPYNRPKSDVGVTDDGYLIIESYGTNVFGQRYSHSSWYGISYFHDLPDIVQPISNATEKGIEFQRFLLRKKSENAMIIHDLQQSFADLSYSDNGVWKKLIKDFEDHYQQSVKKTQKSSGQVFIPNRRSIETLGED